MKLDTLRGYGIAIGSVVLVGSLRLAVAPLVHNRLSSAFFLLAIILAGRYGGFGPSWLALLLGAAASAYVNLSGSLTMNLSSLLPSYLLVYVGLGVALVYLSRSKDERAHGGALPKSLLETQEREKQTLCYEIHDGMIQYATGALLLLDGYRRNHPTANDTETLARVSDGLRHAVDEGRRVIRGLRPTVLDERGVVAGLEDLVDQTKSAGLHVDFRNDPSFERLPDELETALYRIAQEALTNATKHSGTDRVIVELGRNNGDVCLNVQDFGRGFDVQAARDNALGLSGIAARVRLLGGHCSIESQPNAGTRIAVKIPIKKAES